MRGFISFINRLSDFGGYLSGAMMVVGLSLVIIEILVRGLFVKTLYITEEYTGYLMAGLTYFALGYTLKEDGHIRMTFLLHVLSKRNCILLEIVCFTIGLLFSTLLTYLTFGLFWDSVLSGTRAMSISETPLAVPQALLPVGSLIMTLQFVSELAKRFNSLKSLN